MVRMINPLTKTEMYVAEERVEEYRGYGMLMPSEPSPASAEKVEVKEVKAVKTVKKTTTTTAKKSKSKKED